MNLRRNQQRLNWNTLYVWREMGCHRKLSSIEACISWTLKQNIIDWLDVSFAFWVCKQKDRDNTLSCWCGININILEIKLKCIQDYGRFNNISRMKKKKKIDAGRVWLPPTRMELLELTHFPHLWAVQQYIFNICRLWMLLEGRF